MLYEQWRMKLQQIAKDYPKKHFVDVITKYSNAALETVVQLSPVGDPALWKSPAPPGYVGGLFKNNWMVDIGRINPRIRHQIDASGSASLAERSKFSSLTSNPFTTVYIHNSLPYAIPLEHGWSTQAPTGMVSVTVASLKSGIL